MLSAVGGVLCLRFGRQTRESLQILLKSYTKTRQILFVSQRTMVVRNNDLVLESMNTHALHPLSLKYGEAVFVIAPFPKVEKVNNWLKRLALLPRLRDLQTFGAGLGQQL